MFGVDRDHETGTRKASAEMRAQVLGTVSARRDWRETIMAEGNGAAKLVRSQRRADMLETTNPCDHQVLQARDSLALKARRLLALEVGLGGRSAGVVEDRLGYENIETYLKSEETTRLQR